MSINNVKIVDIVNGHKGVIATTNFSSEQLIYTLKGTPQKDRTRESIQIAKNEHVEDNFGIFFNHDSSAPSCKILGREVIALRDIEVGEEITFNYLENEDQIESPFETSSGEIVRK